MNAHAPQSRRWIERRYAIELSADPAQVAAYVDDPRHLNAMTPKWMTFEFVLAPPQQMHEGLIIEYRLRYRGVRLRWVSAIVKYDPPHALAYEQKRGPYAYWYHEHQLTRDAERGVTQLRDVVRYRPPGGLLAGMIDRAVVRRDVDAIFACRYRHLREQFA